MQKVDEVLSRGVANIIPNKKALEKALTSKKLNIYLGIDPTSTHIHLGHAVSLRKIQQCADMGHNVTFLIGDFTSLIGDTSDKDTERPVLTKEQIQENFKTYKSQAEKVLDFSKITVRNNSEWLSKLTFEDIVKLCQHFSVGDFVSRELIRKRLDDGKRVALHEFLYPVMQGYDSYVMDTDLQLGGTDQTFNMQAGRTLQKDLRGKESFVLTTEFLLGTDGRKMSKSWGNAIWLDDTPADMFGKVMSVQDDLIIQYFTLATNIRMEEVGKIEERLKGGENPINIKKELGTVIVSELYSKKEAIHAREQWESVFQKKQLVEEVITPITTHETQVSLLYILTGLTKAAPSNSEARRLVDQGGLSIDDVKKTDHNEMITLKNGMIVKVGKRKFYRIEKS